MPKFEVLEGKHREDGVVYTAGQIVLSPHPLDKLFKNKFRRVQKVVDDTPAPVATATLEPPATKAKKGKGKKTTIKLTKSAPLDARGHDASADFELDDGLKVFARGEVYHVYETGETNPLNPEGLRKTEVQPFLKKYLAE